jgi:NAD(P)-dependent dehydrogenase (short-subunit alcohol dehydrogenase family)
MTRVVAIETGADGITVNAVMPGPVETTHFNRGHPLGSVKRQTVIDKVLVKRLGTPQDVARMVAFLLDRDSGFITGQSIYVCGGTSVTGTGGE